MLRQIDIETRKFIDIPDHPVDRFVFTIVRTTGRKMKEIHITKRAGINIKFKPAQNEGGVNILCQSLVHK